MKITNKYILILLGVALQGCSSFLEEYSQDKYHVSSYQDLDELLIGDCYAPVRPGKHIANARSLAPFIHFLGDEIEEQNKGFEVTDYYDNNIEDRQLKEAIFGYFTWQKRVGQNDTYTGYGTENATWKETYRLINVANNIIEEVENVPSVTDDEKQGICRVKGEAHFLRAQYYFWLANLYGKPYTASGAGQDQAVPLKVEAKVNDIQYQRNTLKEVYAQVVSDLRVAEECLRQTGRAKSIYRADLTAVHLLQSRVCLYMQDWAQAAAYADSVLKVRSQLLDLNQADASRGFLSSESVETLFSMGGNDIPCNMDFRFQSFRVSHSLYQSYADNDLRKTQWWWTKDNFVGYTKLPYGSKYETREPDDKEYYTYGFCRGWLDVQSPVSDKFLFRTAEAYLNKAEAEAYMGHDDVARQYLNALRKSRYKAGTDFEVTSSAEALVSDIRQERRRELALEGHRWFDLRRYGVCEKYPESNPIVHEYTYYKSYNSSEMVHTKVFTLEPFDPAYVLPIPQEVIEYNTGMTNNVRPDRKYTIIEHNEDHEDQ